MEKLMTNFIKNEDGASLAEYGILIALIAAIAIAVVTTLGTKIQAAFQKVVTALN